jgi:feruloyl esterase
LAAPDGMLIGPIDDLNPELPAVPTGAALVPEAVNTPSYCLVTGSVVTNPATGKTANFGLALPLGWNEKLLFSGCGGYCGVVFQNAPGATGGGYPTDALAKGYAMAATDGGHESAPVGYANDASWALSAPGAPNTDAMEDYFHRAVHTVAVQSKLFVQSWYSGDLIRSYFFGCSGGGREAMMEATRYPGDFDGYIAGAPFLDVPDEILSGRGSMALLNATDSYIPSELLSLVDNTVYATCDEADGRRDRLIQNPGRCSFRPESLLCRGDNGVACLTRSQVRTLKTWFSAATDERGRVVSHGFPVSDIYNNGDSGNNLFQWLAAAGPPRDIHAVWPWGSSPLEQPSGWAFMDQAMKYLVHWDPDFNTRHKPAVNEWGVVGDETLELLVARTDGGSADSPRRLDPFLAANRKLLLYHGYSDGWISPFRTVRFYRNWSKRVRGYDVLQRNARLFTVPGMHHCSHGPGPNVFDALGALEQWVEEGLPPESIVALKYENDDSAAAPVRSMPLCPFPTQATYVGEGDVNAMESWSCAPNELLLRVGENGAAAGLRGPGR